MEPQIKQIWIYILSQIGSIYLQFQHSRGGRIMNLRPGLKKHLIYQCTCEFNVISIGRDKTGEDRRVCLGRTLTSAIKVQLPHRDHGV